MNISIVAPPHSLMMMMMMTLMMMIVVIMTIIRISIEDYYEDFEPALFMWQPLLSLLSLSAFTQTKIKCERLSVGLAGA